jgi:hypothetical protein
MSCTDFKIICDELAAERPLNAATQRAGLSHAALCPACAARLQRARGVVAGLRTAASAETEEAPARVKQTLLAAFREQGTQRQAPARVVEISSRRRSQMWIGAAAAAAAVVLLSLVVPTWLRAPSTQTAQRETAQQATPTAPAATPPGVNSQPAPVNAPFEEHTVTQAGERNVAQVSSPEKSSGLARRQRRFQPRAEKLGTETAAQKAGDDFIPLTYLSSATAMESGTVVRVQLSRSALISLGLPVGVSASTESVKADLVIGDDGVARAIRLVE